MKLTFVGCGDAFGSGGRMNTCFHVEGEQANFLIDCGASSLIALKKRHIALNAIRSIFVTHFHADHFGGIPFFILDSQFFSRRVEPLTIAGPRGLADWYERVMETSFPGSSQTVPKFKLNLVELEVERPTSVDEITVTAFQAHHGNPGGPFFSLRLEAEGRTVAYSGDTEWNDSLIPAAKGADVFIAEAYFFDKKVKLHLDLATLVEKLPLIAPKYTILTHMSDDMLGRDDLSGLDAAHDGLELDL